MYLKRLEIQGFKSFATRTTFEFGHAITAIVGPNGSGKSNIADALRWVLGEQSGRLLRARRLEDAIFAGSAKRPPAERVEVTLTLDNSDGWIPLDFTEVAITRRGYRSGESEYFLNRKRVRLRDVQDLLLRAGAGQNSYAIIGQGLVETVLNLRPDERRQLIEEAADIQRYRLKMEEAREKLAATRENMERVRLLIKEIAPRLRHLERQARRAAEHARLSRELVQALRTYYEHQWHRAQEALTVSRAGHDQAQAEFAQAKAALETCQRAFLEVSAGLEERRRAAASAAAESQRLSLRVRELEQALTLAEQRQAILEVRRQELQQELAALEADEARAREALAAHEGRRRELEAAASAVRKSLQERQRDLSRLDREFQGSQAAAADAEAKARRLRAAARDLQARLQRLESAHRELERDARRLDTRRRALISQMAELVRVLRGQRAQEARISADLAQVSARRESLERDIAELREALARVEATQNARRGRVEALEARLEVLNQAQEQFQAAQPEEEFTVEGAVAALYEVLRVPHGLETAIEAVLADLVEAFIFERQADAVAAIESLVERGAPRTAVLPMDTVKQVYPLNLMRERGVLGVASQLVRCPPAYRRLVDALLGRTVVVQDLQTALRVLRRGLGTVVTVDGVVFHPLGPITAGRPRVSRPFLLAHERDLEAIPKEIERIRRSLALTERHAEALRQRLHQAEARLASLHREVEENLARRLRLQGAVAERQQRLAHLRGELRGLIAALGSIREQQASFHREAEEMAQERERLLEEARESQRMGRYMLQAISLVSERREGLLSALSEASAQLASLEGQLRSLEAQREAAEASLSRLEAQASAKAVQLRGLEMELSALQASLRSDGEELERARQALQAFSQEADPEGEAVRHLEARERDLHSQVLSAQGRLLEAERRVLEAETQVRRWEAEIDSLRARIEEDGLTLTPDGEVLPPQGFSPPIPYWLAAERPDDGPEGLRPISGGAQADPEALGREIERLRGQIRSLGPVNVEAQGEYQQLRERHDFLSSQLSDLEGAEHSLHRAIDELNGLLRRRFQSTFQQVAQGFEGYFQAFFGGGRARLLLTDPEEPHTSGVEIEAQPPGRRLQSLAQLSGGEKALTAVALLFALLQANPSPFCVLDEVDAMLDEANVGRFAQALRALSQCTQFIVITHNRKTIETADAIYGVSMGPDGASRVLSLRLADVAAG